MEGEKVHQIPVLDKELMIINDVREKEYYSLLGFSPFIACQCRVVSLEGICLQSK